ncbi:MULTISPECIES: hypothetical protein [Aerosakkonema]|uniref:hypothetical protein n=1 Tax=Aerosakkonema TaxID=1246629 RepID=UPI0035B8F3E5
MLSKKKSFLVKQIFTWLLVLLLLLGYAGQAQAANRDQYIHMTGEKKFTEIKKQVTRSSENVLQYKASDAYQEIVKALKDLRQLHTRIQKADHIDDVIEEVASGLDQIASTYERVANFSTSMTQYRKSEFTYLGAINQDTWKTEQKLKEQITKLESQNRLLQQMLSRAIDKIEAQKLEISLKGNASIIHSLEAQLIIWDKFYLAQKKLLESLDRSGKNIDLLLHILEVNAKVYREAANLARLRHSAKDALENLSSMADIQDIISDLEDSWLQVNDIVDEISKPDFTINIE